MAMYEWTYLLILPALSRVVRENGTGREHNLTAYRGENIDLTRQTVATLFSHLQTLRSRQQPAIRLATRQNQRCNDAQQLLSISKGGECAETTWCIKYCEIFYFIYLSLCKTPPAMKHARHRSDRGDTELIFKRFSPRVESTSITNFKKLQRNIWTKGVIMSSAWWPSPRVEILAPITLGVTTISCLAYGGIIFFSDDATRSRDCIIYSFRKKMSNRVL